MKNLLLILLIFACGFTSAQTVENSSIAVQDVFDNTAPFSFNPKLRFDRTNNILYGYSNGAWRAISGSETIGPTVTILRTFQVGDIIPATTPGELLTYMSFTPPTISLNSLGGFMEVGDVYNGSATGTTTNAGGATLSNGDASRLTPSVLSLGNFGAATSYNYSFIFSPVQGGNLSTSFQATQDWISGSESGTVSSPVRVKQSGYPYFYGVVSGATSGVTSDIYGTLTKVVEDEGDKTILFTGTGLIYFCLPNTWADTVLSTILDSNNLNNIASFDVVPATITSTGLVNNYTAEPCTCYILNTGEVTVTNFELTFNQ